MTCNAMSKMTRSAGRLTDPLENLKQQDVEQGFTYIELVVVILVVAILAAYVAARVGTLTNQSVDGLCDMIRTDIRRMQGLAMKENTTCEIRFGSQQYSAKKSGSNYTDGHFPMRFANLPEFSEIKIDPDVTLRFNPRGQPIDGSGNLLSSNVEIRLTIKTSVQKTISIIANTGHVEMY